MLRKSRMLALVLLTLVPASARAQSADHWYLIRLGGIEVGWMRETRTDGDGGVWVTARTRMVLSRLGSAVVIETTDRVLEGAAGAFLRADTESRLSEQTTATAARVEGDSVLVSTTAGDRTFTRAFPAGELLLGPGGAARVTARALRTEGDSVTFRTFLSTVAMPTTMTRTLQGRDTLLVHGRSVPVRRLVERSPDYPVPATVWVDDEGGLVRTAYDSPFGLTEITLVDSATAIAADGGGTLADDQYARTLVRTQVRLPEARRLALVRLELRMDGSAEWPDLNGPGQRTVSADRERLVLEVTRREPPEGLHPFPVAPTPETAEYLAPNAYVQSDDSTLHTLARRIVGAEPDAWAATMMLERWVAENMQFDPGIAFAPSVEVVRERRGTCMAYATLLASLTRTLGIPSRVAFGYVYVNGMYAGHAWVEVHVGGGWYAADGAIVPYGAADAARFAFAWGSLAGGPGELTASRGVRLYLGLRTTVLAYQVEGEPITLVAAGSAPYRLNGDEYRNETLGVLFRKPADFRWGPLDRVWPSMEIAQALGAPGDTLRVSSELRRPWTSAADDARQRVERLLGVDPREVTTRGGPAWMASAPGRAVAAVARGSETLVLEAVGENARLRMEDLLGSLELSRTSRPAPADDRGPTR